MVQLPPQLAAVVELVCERWELTLSGQAARGDWSTILVASRRGVPCVLKIAGPERKWRGTVARSRSRAWRAAVGAARS